MSESGGYAGCSNDDAMTLLTSPSSSPFVLSSSLTAQLARDLQMDFYNYFPVIFQAIVKTLDTQNTEVLEWSFQCLSYLFKFLWRYMLKDLPTVYK